MLTDNEGTVRDVAQYNAGPADHASPITWFTTPSATSRPDDAGASTPRFTYTGQQFDAATGLYYYSARWYDASTGRFMSQDPAGFSAGDANLYRYVGNDPTNATDPTGMAWGWVSTACTYTAAVGQGVAQGACNIVNGVQDAAVAVANTPAMLWNATAGNLGAGTVGTIASPDWSNDLIVQNDSLHGVSKFVGGQSLVALATLGTSSAGQGASATSQALNALRTTRQAAQCFGAGVGIGKALGERLRGNPGGAGGVGIRAAPGGCFVAGTVVQTDSGARPIESIEAGTLLWGYDREAGQWALRPAVHPWVQPYDGDVVSIGIKSARLEATGNHPFWVARGEGLEGRPPAKELPAAERGMTAGGRWVEARDLRVGDRLVLRGGEGAAIE